MEQSTFNGTASDRQSLDMQSLDNSEESHSISCVLNRLGLIPDGLYVSVNRVV